MDKSLVYCFLDHGVYIEDRRPTSHFGKFRMAISRQSATGHPIHVMFGSRVGFSRSSDRMSLLPVGPNLRSRPLAVLYNFEWPYL